MTARLLFLISSAALAAAASAGGENIQVEGAWARRAPMMESSGAKAGSGNGAVYATLINAGTQPDSLLAAESDVAAAAEIHESYQDMGMMMMRPVNQIDIAAGKKIAMKPGGYHIMLINLKRDLKPGEPVKLTLRFDKAGAVRVNATVK